MFLSTFNKWHRIFGLFFFFFPASHSNIRNFTKYNYSQCGRAEEGSRLQLFKGEQGQQLFLYVCGAQSVFVTCLDAKQQYSYFKAKGNWFPETSSHTERIVFLPHPCFVCLPTILILRNECHTTHSRKCNKRVLFSTRKVENCCTCWGQANSCKGHKACHNI